MDFKLFGKTIVVGNKKFRLFVGQSTWEVRRNGMIPKCGVVRESPNDSFLHYLPTAAANIVW